MSRSFRVVSDDHSNHNLPIGATVQYLGTKVDDSVDVYTQGVDDDDVAIDPRDLEPLDHEFIVTVEGCTKEEAEQVIAERLNHDEDYGFDYTIEWRRP